MVWPMQQQYADSFFFSFLFLLFYSFLADSTGRPIASAIIGYTANIGAVFFQVDFCLYVYKYTSMFCV